MNFNEILRIAIITSCLALAGCPVTVKVKVTNESSSEIAILYSTGYESIISPGETKEELYKFDCFLVKTAGKLLEFQQIRPPDHYFDTGISSSTIYAVFTHGEELKIYKKNGTAADVITLERGCSE